MKCQLDTIRARDVVPPLALVTMVLDGPFRIRANINISRLLLPLYGAVYEQLTSKAQHAMLLESLKARKRQPLKARLPI